MIYLVTEYLSGGTIADFMRNRSKLLGETITNIISDVLLGLKYLMKLGYMHRDIKPENIILREEDQKWVLADFGLAARVDQPRIY